MTLTYWSNYSKKKNSTAQPTSGTDVTMVLKDDCSIINPVIRSATMPASANYCYISEWGRYYFVTNCVYISNTVKEFTLEVDVLASYKSAIGSTTAPIMFSSSGYDIEKIDSRLPVKYTKTMTYKADDTPFFSLTGTYILTIVSTSGHTGVTAQVALNEANMNTLCNAICTTSTLQDDIKKFASDAFSSILNCIWIPCDLSDIPGTSITSINIGATSVNVSGKLLSGAPVRGTLTATINIPWTYNDFRRMPPYTTAQAWIPGYGIIELNTADFADQTSLRFKYMIDCGTGDVICSVCLTGSDDVLQTVSYNFAVKVAISNISMDINGIVGGIGSFGASAAGTMLGIATGNVAAGVSGALSMVSSGSNLVLSANRRIVESKGAIGGRAAIAFSTATIVYVETVDCEDPDDVNYIAKKGRPVGIVATISSYSGFIQCDNASVSCSGTAIEKDRVNSYLNSGFFYE